MARKRGGLAGIYDRNKKVIKTLAPIAAGFIPGVGPAIGAALGAAMGGDREGKGYFKGFNTKGAALGGLSGYGGAKLGQAVKGKLSGLFTGGVSPGVSPVDKLTGAPKMGVMTQTTGPSSYGAIGSYQPPMPTDALLSGAGPKGDVLGKGFTRLTAAQKGGDVWTGAQSSTMPFGFETSARIDTAPKDFGTGIIGVTDEGKTFTNTPYKFPELSKGFQGSTTGLPPMNKPPRIGELTQLAPDQTIESTFGRRPYYNPPTPTLRKTVGGIADMYRASPPPPDSSLFGKDGMIEQNKTLFSGIGKGIMGVRQGNFDQQQADAEMAERTRQFDKTYGINAAQEADRKRREEDLMAQRAAFRAMFTGMA